MFTKEEHLDNLIRHISLVRDACVLLGKRLDNDQGRLLIARGFIHDASKFHGIEWECLHVGPGVTKRKLDLAIKQHVHTNSHHPEYHGGIKFMPPVDVAEMVCDWYARAQEFGTSLVDWIEADAVKKFKIKRDSQQYKWIGEYTSLLLESPFKK